MMSIVNDILSNQILITGAVCWLVAQVIKTLIYLVVNRQLRLERLVGDGGMPSCHSACVAGIATATAIAEGIRSPLFAIAFFFAIIVMHDAMGVRQETGKQARIINDIVEEIRERGITIMSMSPEERLKEFVGHTGTQVCVGAVIGILSALIQHFVFYS